jgi:hypothetical protein
VNRSAYASTFALICLASCFLMSCIKGSKAPAPTIAITAISGTPQNAMVGTAFPLPLQAKLAYTYNGSPVTTVLVTFTAPSTTGASGLFANGAVTEGVLTDQNGIATSSIFTADATFGGPYAVTASATTLGIGMPASFSLTNTSAGPFADTISATSGTPQSATIGMSFAPLQATVTLPTGLPASGVAVTFTAPATGASGTFANGTATEIDTTNANGVANSSVFTANSMAGGPYTVAATTPLAPVPAGFTLTNLAGPPATIIATSGTPQSATVSSPFAVELQAKVLDSGSNPVIGAAVTFTAPPATGASGYFANGTPSETDTTNVNGVAFSSTFTADATAGGPYTVTATVAGVATPANFSLTNTAGVSGTNSYAFYMSGQAVECPDCFYNLAGSVTVNSTGTVVGGIQDYHSLSTVESPEPSGDSIIGGALTVTASTGLGTLTLITNDVYVGVNGTETFAVQFVNSDHALIIEYDGTATSSGSMDLQKLTNPPSLGTGSYAFILSGMDGDGPFPIAYGGVFTIPNSGTSLQNGLYDSNDFYSGVVRGATLSGTFSEPDAFGRGTITSNLNSYSQGSGSIGVTLNYYVIGPEAIRIIDVDLNDTAVGSAFGQGINANYASNSSLGNSVLAIAGNPSNGGIAVLGQFSTSNTSSSTADFSGVADENDLANSVRSGRALISGTYSIANNGYGSFTIQSGDLADYISAQGIYMTDPNLNINDPNNTVTGGGGALVLDMDTIVHYFNNLFAGITGVIIPQTDTSTASFTGNYAFGAQDFNAFNPSSTCSSGLDAIPCELDFVGQGSVSSLVLSGTALISDPDFTLGLSPNVTFGLPVSAEPLADTTYPGRYALGPGDALAFDLGYNQPSRDLDMVIYQASGGQLFWLEDDYNGVLLGPLEQQGSLAGIPVPNQGLPEDKTSEKK